ncbi:MAG TPA: Crp/Fnr family transcriptional regulator [Acidimicrobiales bacterium]|nr:Crp/Fnr family transcriptional regulator [Acidimicrobiales bacterium]
MEALELLGRAELFRFFDTASLDDLAAHTLPIRYGRNEIVFTEGATAERLYVVRSGRIAIAKRAFDGRESVVALMEEGDLFGEMPLFDGQPRSAEARSLEPTELVVVPYPAVRDILEAKPKLLWGVVELLALRLRQTDSALADSMFLDVTGRTAKRLLELAGSNDEFVLPVTQEELAGMVGASRERVNKALSAFIRLGWIDQADRRYRILDRPQLSQRAL